MTKQSISRILEHLDGFPEDKIYSLIDYVDYLKQRDIFAINEEKENKLSNSKEGLQAGPWRYFCETPAQNATIRGEDKCDAGVRGLHSRFKIKRNHKIFD